jgi:hypothetical protein
MLRTAYLLVTLLFIWFPVFGQQDGGRPSSQSQSSGEIAPSLAENPAARPPQQWSKLTARTDLVLVPVIVTDKSGKHVSGLKKEAFRIEENGNFRSVSVFEETETEKPAIHGRDTASEGYSNFISGDERPWRLTTIVLDKVNATKQKSSIALDATA